MNVSNSSYLKIQESQIQENFTCEGSAYSLFQNKHLLAIAVSATIQDFNFFSHSNLSICTEVTSFETLVITT